MAKNPLIPAKDHSNLLFQQLHKSAGILDDFAVRKNVATKEGTIEKVPVNDNDIANKAYVDSVAGAGITISDTTTVNLTLTGIDLTADVIAGGVDHDSLLNFVANEHIDWTQDQGATNIHAGNYTNTTYTAGTGMNLDGTEFDCTITQYTDALAVSAVATADDYLKNDAADVGVGLTLTGDNSSADTAYVPMVLYNTDATPPAASGFPIGTIYIQYTA